MRVSAIQAGAFLSMLVLAACGGSPVASGLDETQANRMVVALDRAKVAAEKEMDPTSEGHFQVVVGRDDATRALIALRDDELPRARATTLLEATSAGGSLVPSATAEHAALLAGLQGELDHSLEMVPGVLAARVHLNVPMPDTLTAFAPRPKSSASVLLEHAGVTPPISPEAVARLVAHAIGDLDTSDVSVVMVPKLATGSTPAVAQLTHVLSIAIAPGSTKAFYWAIAVAGLIGATLLSVTLYLLWRLRKLEGAATAAAEDAST